MIVEASSVQHSIPPIPQDFLDFLLANDGGCMIEVKPLSAEVYAGISRLLYHWTLRVGMIGDQTSYFDRYCYETLEKAQHALKTWDGQGDPVGWHRHPSTGRRRPNGDPKLEYIAF